MKIIDLLSKIAKGEKVPNKIKWRDETWKYDDRIQDYTNKHLMLFEQLKMIRTKEFLNDEVEILDEVEDKGYEDIEEIGNLLYCENQVESILHRKIDALIRNQKKIIEVLNDNNKNS